MARFRRRTGGRRPILTLPTWSAHPYPVQTRTFWQARPFAIINVSSEYHLPGGHGTHADHPRALDPRGHGCIRPARCLLRLGGDGHASGVSTQASDAGRHNPPPRRPRLGPPPSPDSDRPGPVPLREAPPRTVRPRGALPYAHHESTSCSRRPTADRCPPSSWHRTSRKSCRWTSSWRRGRSGAELPTVIRHSTRSSSRRFTPPRTSSSGTTSCSGTSTPRPSNRSSPRTSTSRR